VHLEGRHRVVQVREVKLRIGVDSGGTFTDIVIDSDDGIVLKKVPSTPDDPARAILTALDPLDPDEVIHGSTVATNALLERKLARAAFVTNRGFVELLDIGRQRRPAIYDLEPDPVPALIPVADRFGISGRLGPGGQIIEPLDEEELIRLSEQIGAAGFEAVAVGLLHSTEQGCHEERVGELLSTVGIPVILSREVAAEPREWERFTTACASAACGRRCKVFDRF
jgi:N-methylhydantoinase A